MTIWEYDGFTFKPSAGFLAPGAIKADEFFAQLNKWGAKGWELVGMLPVAISGGLTNDIAVVFKRVKGAS